VIAMNKMALLFGAAGLALTFVLGKSKTASAAEPAKPEGKPGDMPTGSTIPPVAIITRIANVMATGDPDQMDKLATQLQSEGWPAQATDLRAAAAKLRGLKDVLAKAGNPQQQNPNVATGGAAIPPDVLAAVNATIAKGDVGALQVLADSLRARYPTLADKITSIITQLKAKPAQLPPNAAGKTLAAKVALNVHTTKAGQEDKPLMKTFQTNEKLKKVDGLWGSETALAVAKYGIVPDKPRHWGTSAGGYNSVLADKQSYRTALLAIAKTDPVRAEEWAAAAKV
jgi:hypothetical protein